MCEPLTIASAALTALGTYQQYQSQKDAQKETERVLARNAETQEGLRRDSQVGVTNAADAFKRDKFDQNQEDQTAQITQKLTDNLSQGVLPGEYYGGRQSENTRQYAETKSAESTDFSKELAAALGRMRGFDAGLRTTNVGINRASEGVMMNNNFMDGNNAILPIQLEAAKQKASNPLADIMVGIGGAGLSAGLSGGSGPMTTRITQGANTMGPLNETITWNTGRNGAPYNAAQKWLLS